MNKEFVPYDIALAMKELGFNEQCFDWYDHRGLGGTPSKNSEEWLICNNYCCSAPLYQQAFRWFIDKHGLIGSIDLYKDCSFDFCWSIRRKGDRKILCGSGRGYKDEGSLLEAQRACLKKLIEICQEKTK